MNAVLTVKINALARKSLTRIGQQRHLLCEAVRQLKAGEFFRLSEIFDLTHQIAGTSGTFGYGDVSRKAEAINQLVLALEPDQMHGRFAELDELVTDFTDTVTLELRREALAGHSNRRRGDKREQRARQDISS